MPKPKTREERLFAAACVRLGLERAGASHDPASALYGGILGDLEIDDRDVTAYLAEHKDEVARALDRKSSGEPAPR